MYQNKKILKGLDQEQLKATTCENTRILVLAPAGSGKTRVLVTRTAHLLFNRIGPLNIACLKFTRKAGEEMKSRLLKIDQSSKGIFCNTIHSFCIEIISRFGYHLGFDKNFSIIDQDTRMELLEDIAKKTSYKKSMKSIADKLAKFHKFYKLDMPLKEKTIILEYLDYLKELNALDLDLVLYTAWRLLENPVVKEYYHNQYRHILIDECQDMNDIQNMIIEQINPVNVFYVGDDAQSIYGFNGGKVDYILKFKKNNPAGETIILKQNYRSKRAIVELANRIIERNSNQVKKEMIANSEGGAVNYFIAKNDEAEATLVVGEVLGLAYEYKDIAIFARTNKQLDVVRRKLNEFKVPIKSEDTIKLNSDLKAVLRIISFSINDRDKNALEKSLEYLKIITNEQLLEIKRCMLDNENSLYQELRNHPFNDREDIDKFFSIINEIKNYIRNNPYPSKIIKHIIEIFKLERLVENKNTLDKLIDYSKQWEEKRVLEGMTINTSILIEQLQRDGIRLEPTEGVNLLSIHKSKGLEFKKVFLIGVCDGLLPSSRGDMEEEIRLMHVAITRAIEDITISAYKYGKDFLGKQKEYNESFIKDIL